MLRDVPVDPRPDLSQPPQGYWLPLLVVYAITSVVTAIVSISIEQLLDEGTQGSLWLSVLGTVGVPLLACWSAVAAVRVLLRHDGVTDAVLGALLDAPRLALSALLLAVLILPMLLIVPGIVLLGSIAVDRRFWGVGRALRLGVLRFFRNFGVYGAWLVILDDHRHALARAARYTHARSRRAPYQRRHSEPGCRYRLPHRRARRCGRRAPTRVASGSAHHPLLRGCYVHLAYRSGGRSQCEWRYARDLRRRA